MYNKITTEYGNVKMTKGKNMNKADYFETEVSYDRQIRIVVDKVDNGEYRTTIYDDDLNDEVTAWDKNKAMSFAQAMALFQRYELESKSL